jgi:outer membrane protein OmpA-like peptidoglycan-associated protein
MWKPFGRCAQLVRRALSIASEIFHAYVLPAVAFACLLFIAFVIVRSELAKAPVVSGPPQEANGEAPRTTHDRPGEAQMLEALKARVRARGAHGPAAGRERGSDDAGRIIQDLLKKDPHTITVDDRRRVAEIASGKPGIDLDVTFEDGSAAIGPNAIPKLITLGRVLAGPELKEATFLIAGHADGSDSYNQWLSERRADAVKNFLVERFKVSPGQLLAVGFGRSQLKNAKNPRAAENRRVQIVNIGQ